MAPPPRPAPGSLSALLADLAHVPEAPLAQAPAAGLRPGDLVDRYQLVAELGRGSFGVVYQARALDGDRQVALKVVRAGRADAAGDQLQREADTIARLAHPSLVALLDAGRCEAGPYLVLELLRGRTLRERLRTGPLGATEALRVALEAARGLAHAHARGVVHRDLKPSNVFLCEDGSIRLLDFGLAHAFGLRRLDGGTPDYMAPEQWRGAPEDERTDVFALGVLLYRMLAGELPFPDDGGRSATSPHPAPRLDVPDAPGLGSVIGTMLAKDPVERPRDGGEVVATLEALRIQAGDTASASSTSVRVRRFRRPASRWATAGIAAAAVAAIGTALWLGRPAPPADDAARPSLAVLPFDDGSPDQDQGHLAEGLAEEITNALTQLDGLKVAGRTSAFAFKGAKADLQTIGRRLGVSAVLEGTVRVEGPRVRVTAELVKTTDGFHLWSHTFEREWRGVFAVQDEIAAAVVDALKVKLLPGRGPTSRELRTTVPGVYDLYLQGRRQQRRDYGPEWLEAEAAFQKALALDPDYAPAWAALATALYFNHGNSGPTLAAVQEGKARAVAAAERAVALAPDLADGYAARAQLRVLVSRDWAGGLADMERATLLNPGDPELLWRQARFILGPVGRTAEAVKAARLACERDPLSAAAWSTLAALDLADGRPAHARTTALRALELDPTQDAAPIYLATALLLEHDPAGALAAVRRSPEPIFHLQFEALALPELGRQGEAAAALARLVADHGHDAPFQIAAVHAWRGEADEAFRWLQTSVDLDDGGLPDIRMEPLLFGLHADPRYPALLARIGLPTVEPR